MRGRQLWFDMNHHVFMSENTLYCYVLMYTAPEYCCYVNALIADILVRQWKYRVGVEYGST